MANPNDVQNPEFPTPGLYSVHASASILTSTGAVLLRSNEQLVSVGRSQALPKHTYGRLSSFDPEKRNGTLSLGSLHKITPGDVFTIRGGKMGSDWNMTITRTEATYSFGLLEPAPPTSGALPREPRLPKDGNVAVLQVPSFEK
ncbi:MAG TPA: hypothetical protein VMZ27_13450 [Candidatus Saccharimonadales bacterium]|nr:hypothetical protein [Candidatus Saccharimonadales bacterium]